MSGPGHFSPQVVRGPAAAEPASPEWTPEQLAEFRAGLNEALRSGAHRLYILPAHPATLCSAVVQVPPEFDVPDEHRAGIEISVTATQSYPITADLADRIREIVWESMRAAR